MNTKILELLANFPFNGNWFYAFDSSGTPVGDVSFISLCILKALEWIWNYCGITSLTGIELTHNALLCDGYVFGIVIISITLLSLSWKLFGQFTYACLTVFLFASTVGVINDFYSNIQTLFFVTFSLISVWCVWSGYSTKIAPVRLFFGYLSAVIATMIGGPIGFAIPLIIGLLSLMWGKSKGRLHSLDGVLTFGFSFAILVVWIASLIIPDKTHSISNAISGFALSQFALPNFSDIDALLESGKKFIVYTLPWIFLILCIPFERIGIIKDAIKESREEAPLAPLPYVLLTICTICVIFSWNNPTYVAPMAMIAYALVATKICASLSRMRLKIALILATIMLLGMILYYLVPIAYSYLSNLFENVELPSGHFGWFDNLMGKISSWIDFLKGKIF